MIRVFCAYGATCRAVCDILHMFFFCRSGEMADAADLKSAEGFPLYGFESRLRHHWKKGVK